MSKALKCNVCGIHKTYEQGGMYSVRLWIAFCGPEDENDRDFEVHCCDDCRDNNTANCLGLFEDFARIYNIEFDDGKPDPEERLDRII